MTCTRHLATAMRVALAALAALVALAGCLSDDATTKEQPSDVPDVGLSDKMYPLMNSSLTPLAPVNSVTKAIFARACVSKADGNGPDAGDFFKQDAASVAFVKYAKSRSQVDDALSVKVSAAFAGPTAGAAAEVEASTSTSTRAESIYLLGELFAYTYHVLAATCPLVITEDATELLLDDSAFTEVAEADRARYRAAAFMRTCGDGWTHTRLMGAGGTLILEWKSKSAEAKNAIRADLEVSFGKPVLGGKIGVSVAAAKNRLNASAEMTTTLVTRGSIAGMPGAGDIDGDPNKLNDIVTKLDELVQKLKEPGGDVSNLSPMSARLAAYNGLPPWGGWKNYDAAQKAKIRASLALIKPLAEEMEKFLALRANLIKELDYDLAQIEAITNTYPRHFNYSGAEKNYAGTEVLPRHGTTPSYPDLAHYKASFPTWKTKLQAEMAACKDDGANGFQKCKPSATLPAAVAKEIRKWRENRPKKLDVWTSGITDTREHAIWWCNERGGGLLATRAEARYARAWSVAYLPTHPYTAWAGHHAHFISDEMSGEKCNNGALAHSKVYDPDDNKSFNICGTQPMWQIHTLCRGKASLWDGAYWKDELDLTGL
jgi:hypothetical protein